VVYAFLGAPDVALVAVLIETIFALLFLGMLTLMPRTILRFETRRSDERPHERRDLFLGVTAGALAFLVVWGALSRPAAPSSVVGAQIAQTPLAHGGDVVTAILADFRGFDTLGEVTVVLIVLLGVLRLLRRSHTR
jgi:multicomponent Na+:H+ antiporter subunit A